MCQNNDTTDVLLMGAGVPGFAPRGELARRNAAYAWTRDAVCRVYVYTAAGDRLEITATGDGTTLDAGSIRAVPCDPFTPGRVWGASPGTGGRMAVPLARWAHVLVAWACEMFGGLRAVCVVYAPDPEI